MSSGASLTSISLRALIYLLPPELSVLDASKEVSNIAWIRKWIATIPCRLLLDSQRAEVKSSSGARRAQGRMVVRVVVGACIIISEEIE